MRRRSAAAGWRRAPRTLLRFLTCGSVDDGKSTLIGRLLYDAEADLRGPARGARARIPASTAPPATRSTSRCWSTGWRPSASRASPSTSPTAIFATPRRSFIVADTPGPRAIHPQHGDRRLQLPISPCSWSMRARACWRRPGATLSSARCSASATSCWRSTRWTWSASTRRCSTASSATYATSPRRSASRSITPIPISARYGDNVIDALEQHALVSTGPPLLEYLETRRRRRATAPSKPFRFPVQWVNRPNLDFRGFAGTVVIGLDQRRATQIVVAALGPELDASSASSPATATSTRAEAGDAVTLTLDRRDRHRARRRAGAADATGREVADQFAAHLIWMSDEHAAARPLLPA